MYTGYMDNRKCDKCGGAGTIGGFRHVAGGVCFECDGSGWVDVLGTDIKSQYYMALPSGEFRQFIIYVNGDCYGPNGADSIEAMRIEARKILAMGGAFIDG